MSKNYSSDNNLQKLFESFRSYTNKQPLNEGKAAEIVDGVLDTIARLMGMSSLAEINMTLGDAPFSDLRDPENIQILQQPHLRVDMQKLAKAADDLKAHITNLKGAGDPQGGNERQIMRKIQNRLLAPLGFN